ncbi:uncharacterized protein LOC130625012 [Hydractinia symbiolongicarpus]|uniref:uncharacterized protein LOC130625012 n=1 Tax=Hydractinia symbiolongicarpus TaxID=13093 RepID=UPI00254DCF09|nr:uncharacterized protein LOC130625012 [Hydractinia symbiolongicarpus]
MRSAPYIALACFLTIEFVLCYDVTDDKMMSEEILKRESNPLCKFGMKFCIYRRDVKKRTVPRCWQNPSMCLPKFLKRQGEDSICQTDPSLCMFASKKNIIDYPSGNQEFLACLNVCNKYRFFIGVLRACQRQCQQ